MLDVISENQPSVKCVKTSMKKILLGALGVLGCGTMRNHIPTRAAPISTDRGPGKITEM